VRNGGEKNEGCWCVQGKRCPHDQPGETRGSARKHQDKDEAEDILGDEKNDRKELMGVEEG
jgi:hypothetical protein